MVGLDALPTYKRVAAWFLGPVEDTGCYLQKLQQVYERREEPNGVRLVLSVDSKSITALEGLGWRPFSSVGCAAFPLLSAKPEGRK